jgi:hypothetical protein
MNLKADIKDLISWLETKSGHYDYQSRQSCLLAQYLMERGYHFVRVSSSTVSFGNRFANIPEPIQRISTAPNYSGHHGHQLYSDALNRAKVELALYM